MNPTMSDIGVAAVLLVAAAALLVWIRGYMAGGSERRMRRMLARVGLDPEMAASADRDTIIAEVRRRCRKCQSEALCERWLAGEEEGGNEFCPNARVFEMLSHKTRPAG